jgi:hypothetical protein
MRNKEKTMEKKRVLMGVLAVALVFGMTAVGCGVDHSGEPEEWNKFYGGWGEATEVNLIGITNSDEIAGIVLSFPYSYTYLSSLGSPIARDSLIDAVKIGSTWYSCDYDAWRSKGLSDTEQWYYFTNTHYHTTVGKFGVEGDSIPYTFNDTNITINGINYPYIIAKKRRGTSGKMGWEISILDFNDKYYLSKINYYD